MEYVGGASGATLGFIANNLPGAVAGWKIGRYFGRKFGRKSNKVSTQMPPVKRKANRLLQQIAKRQRTNNWKVSAARLSAKPRSFRTVARAGRKRHSRRGGARRRRGGRGYTDESGSSSCTVKGRRRFRGMFKGFKKVLGPRQVRCVTSTKLPYSGNTQGSVQVNMFYNGANNSIYMGGFLDIEELVKNLRVDQFEPPGLPDQYKTMKFWIPKIKTVSRIRNMGTAPSNVTIYDIVARKDQTTAAVEPITAWGTGLFNAQIGTLGTGVLNVAEPGVTPFMSQTFTQLFKVKKVNEFTLHAGSTHKHYFTLYPNKMWTVENTNTTTYHAGETCFVLIVAKGDVGQDTTIGPTFGSVAYTQGVLEIITEYAAKVQAMEKNRALNTWYDSLLGGVTGTTQVVEDTDIVAPVTTV